MNDLARIASEREAQVREDRAAARGRPTHFALAVVALGLALYVHTQDYQDAVIEELRAEQRATERLAAPIRYDTAPRCGKRNSAGEWLLLEIAQRPDGLNWTYECRYQGESR